MAADDESDDRDKGVNAEPAEPEAIPPEAAAKETPEVPTGASPDAIAKRVAALDEGDEAEKIARLEEEKLAARRERVRTRGKKGLESAASKKLRDIGTKPKKKKAPVESAPAEAADPLIEKTVQLSAWFRKNSKAAAIAGLALTVFLVAFGVNTYVKRRHAEAASTELAKALEDARGRIGAAGEDADDDEATPVFKTAEERRDSALAKYRDVAAKFGGTGAGFLAELGAGSLLLDKGDGKGAFEAYDAVAKSPLAAGDPEVKGRALEGRGLALELEAKGLSGEPRTAKLTEALAAFKELETTGVKGFEELGMYHEGRMLELTAQPDKAKEVYKKLYERATKPGENHPFPYLEQVAEERVRAIDPDALPPKRTGELGGIGGNQMTEAQMKQIEELMKKRAQQAGQKK